MSVPENPNAFPSGDFQGYEPGRGMTLRDHFAGQALTGICAHADTWGLSDSDIVTKAYKIAGLMLAEREKGGES